mmetsp:Transcript_24318/g.43930  ORF Transcript_24318/g.43930 Transcript_24318/m.43930 type:complete len:301 (-) Transcript_24318:2835-3737(-)
MSCVGAMGGGNVRSGVSVGKQELQVLLRQLGHRRGRPIDRPLKDQHLLLLQLHHPLLDGVLGHEPVRGHGLGLPNAVGPLNGLHLHGGIPPGIEHEHVGRHLQVQALPASLQGDKDHLDAVVLAEGPQHGLPHRNGQRPHQHDGLDPRPLQPPVNDVQHVGVLGEDDGLGLRGLGPDPLQQLHQPLHFGARGELLEVDLLQDVVAPHRLDHVLHWLRGIEPLCLGTQVHTDRHEAYGAPNAPFGQLWGRLQVLHHAITVEGVLAERRDPDAGEHVVLADPAHIAAPRAAGRDNRHRLHLP